MTVKKELCMKNAIYIVTGIMASGKSTIAELLSRRFDRGVHLRGDVFRRMITSGREEMTQNASEEAVKQLHLRYNLAATAARQYYDNGFSVVMQDNYLCSELDYIITRLNGYTLYVIVLCPSIEAVKQREAGRGKKGYIGFEVEDLYHAFMKETPRIGLWIDTSDLSAEQTIEQIVYRVENEARIEP
jgi:chloramphenicol 3-O-phosphotransferase